MDNELTQEEKEVILQLLNQVQIRPAQPDASEMLALCQSIIKKLTEKENNNGRL